MTLLTSETRTLIVELVYFIINYRVNIYNGIISIPVLDTMFSILIHYLYRSSLAKNHTQIGWLQGFFASIVMGCGGGSTVAILRGEPIGIFKSNEFWMIHGITYWLMFSNNQFYKLIHFLMRIPPIEYTFLISDGFLRAMAMLQFGVEGCNPLTLGGEDNDKYIAKLICGTLAGIGGGFFMDAFQLNQPHWSFGTPKSLKVISGEMKITFLTVCFYLLSKKEGNIYLHYFDPKYINDLLPSPLSLDDLLLSDMEAQAWSCILLTLGLIFNSMLSSSLWNYFKSTPVNTAPVIINKRKNKNVNNNNNNNNNNEKSTIAKKNQSSKKKNQAKKLD